MIIKVRATRDGFYKGARRRAGAVFDVVVDSEEKLGRWMEKINIVGNTAGKAVAEPVKPAAGRARGAAVKPVVEEEEKAADEDLA